MDYYIKKEDMVVKVHSSFCAEITFKESINMCNDDTCTYEIPFKEIREQMNAVD